MLRAVGAERLYTTDQNDAEEAAVSDDDVLSPEELQAEIDHLTRERDRARRAGRRNLSASYTRRLLALEAEQEDRGLAPR